MIHGIAIASPRASTILSASRDRASARSRLPSCRSTMLRFEDSTQTMNSSPFVARELEPARHDIASALEVTRHLERDAEDVERARATFRGRRGFGGRKRLSTQARRLRRIAAERDARRAGQRRARRGSSRRLPRPAPEHPRIVHPPGRSGPPRRRGSRGRTSRAPVARALPAGCARARANQVAVFDALRRHPERHQRRGQSERLVRLPGIEVPVQRLEQLRVACLDHRGGLGVLAPDPGARVLGHASRESAVGASTAA